MTILRTAIPITSPEQWHELRRQNVGCSEIGALFGVHDYITGFALAARKLGKLPYQIDDAVLRRGRLLEPVAKQMLAEAQPDWSLLDPSAYYSDSEIRFGCTPDLFVRTDRGLGVVQIKTVAPQIFAGKWHNDAGTIEPPLWIALQAMGEQHLTGADFAYVAVLVVGYGLSLELVEVPYLPDVVESMRARVVAFWELVGRGELPPPDYGRDGRHLAKVYVEDDGSELDLTSDNELPEIAAQYEALKAAKQTAQAGIDEAQAKILHKLGSAQRARFAGGVITAKTIARKEHWIPASSYRRMTVKHDRKRSEDAA
jgi:predicted phage-related endonuclease